MREFLIALALLAGTIAQASAADPIGKGDRNPAVPTYSEPERADWSGAYVAVGVGYSAGDLYESPFEGGVAISNPHVTGRVGYDIQRGAGVLGGYVEASYLLPSKVGVELDDPAIGIDANYQLCGGLRGGLVMDRTLGYVTGGYCWYPWEGGEGEGKLDFAGPFAGVGLEHDLGGGLKGGIETRYEWLSDEPAPGYEVNLDQWKSQIFISYHF